MKNMSLSELITTRVGSNLNHIALVGKSKKVDFSELVGSSGCMPMHGKRVILFIKDTIVLVKALVSLDGSARAICPISTQISKKELYHLVSNNEFDAVISDLAVKDLEIFSEFNISSFAANEFDLVKNQETEQFNQSTAWLVPTSGTTSLPKLVCHTLASLGAASLRRDMQNQKNEIWGQFYDVTRYAGYQTLLNSLLNGHTLVTLSAEDSIYERVARCAEEYVTHISATPSQWRKILMTGAGAKKIPLEQIVLGGEAADQKILNALNGFYPDAKITHTYASTEVGLGLSVSDRLAGFPIRFIDGSEGFSEISIRNERLFMRSISGASTYVGGKPLQDVHGWIDTGDIVRIEGDRFFVIGRQSGILNIGGDKVNPENIRQILLEHPDVVQVSVFGKESPITGMVLAANIQLKSNVEEELVKASIKTFIKDNLQAKDQPRLVKFVDDIELTNAGKLGADYEK
jgi:acyl-CoA synthetase (AMP-forming)/AMP-acid ligase II